MARVYVSVGSNIDRTRHVCAALDALRATYGPLQCSPVYETTAVGFDGDDFYNLVVGFDTDATPAEVAVRLHAIEDDNERVRTGPRYSPRTLDLDLLLYDDLILDQGHLQLPRDEITRHAFVLKPLADIAGACRHPLTGKTYAQLWAEFDTAGQALHRVELPYH